MEKVKNIFDIVWKIGLLSVLSIITIYLVKLDGHLGSVDTSTQEMSQIVDGFVKTEMPKIQNQMVQANTTAKSFVESTLVSLREFNNDSKKLNYSFAEIKNNTHDLQKSCSVGFANLVDVGDTLVGKISENSVSINGLGETMEVSSGNLSNSIRIGVNKVKKSTPNFSIFK